MRLIGLGLAVVLTVRLALAPLAADAQQAGKVYRVGVLSSASSIPDTVGRAAFLERLSDLGWVVGQNLTSPHRRRARGARGGASGHGTRWRSRCLQCLQ
jgi:hypothetical protein